MIFKGGFLNCITGLLNRTELKVDPREMFNAVSYPHGVTDPTPEKLYLGGWEWDKARGVWAHLPGGGTCVIYNTDSELLEVVYSPTVRYTDHTGYLLSEPDYDHIAYAIPAHMLTTESRTHYTQYQSTSTAFLKLHMALEDYNQGSFSNNLWKAIFEADRTNQRLLELAYPDLIKAYRAYTGAR